MFSAFILAMIADVTSEKQRFGSSCGLCAIRSNDFIRKPLGLATSTSFNLLHKLFN